ncbi:ADP-heptose--lipooligosaccharide heptosyltransferase II [hydrothermal vent metagenome]|uniref:ADP-heptose--lipooligosaccharide heptosyltransferase II n=1 Tax=hydrothermal vent metagenome TaxID=652676 RepID=A0A3B1AEP1_9ZZZZ
MNSCKITTTPKNILICRTDKLGDFVLSLPSFILLKKALPNTKIIALTQEYTKPIAELCNAIDDIVCIPKSDSTLKTVKNSIAAIKPLKIDVSISLFTTATLALGLLLSKISIRLAPATKIDQLFYNYRLKQRRSLSLKPEFEYNLDLTKHYLKLSQTNYDTDFERPVISIEPRIISTTKNEFCDNNKMDKHTTFIFIHVGSGGSANNLTPEQYAKLISLLNKKLTATFVLCEGPEDSSNVEKTISQLMVNNVIRYVSDKGLLEFTKHIAFADFFISGSTGPLHIAGALDIPTAGFYPNRRSATATRWKTLNSENNLLSCSPPEDHSEDMTTIDLELISSQICTRLNSNHSK